MRGPAPLSRNDAGPHGVGVMLALY